MGFARTAACVLTGVDRSRATGPRPSCLSKRTSRPERLECAFQCHENLNKRLACLFTKVLDSDKSGGLESTEFCVAIKKLVRIICDMCAPAARKVGSATSRSSGQSAM